MSSGTACLECGRHMRSSVCDFCGYQEPERGLTYTKPRKRATDERPLSEPNLDALRRMSPDQREVNRRGMADARARLELVKARRAGWMRDVVNVETKGRV